MVILQVSEFYEDKIILVCGGTGSIGSKIVEHLLRYNPKAIRIFSNSENELWDTKMKFESYSSKLRFLLGDIRDFERVRRAVEGTDIIFNAAAIKHVPISEYNPVEAINVNIHGIENLIEAALIYNVQKLIHISTDKAVNPTSVMGATKLLSERLCISRQLAKGKHTTKISCVRFGNVLGTRGSIIPLIKEQLERGDEVTLTNDRMRRFIMSESEATELVLKAACLSEGGEIFVLKMPNLYIKDLIEVIIEEYCPIIGKEPKTIKIKSIGTRPGEKLDEKLIAKNEYVYLFELKDMYIIYPLIHFEYNKSHLLLIKNGAKEIKESNFSYGTKNVPVIDKSEIKKLLNEFELLKKKK